MKKLFVRARVLLFCFACGVGLAQSQPAHASSIVISNYSTLDSAVGIGGTSTFGSNVTVSLSGASEILEVSSDVVLDGTTNSAIITRTSGSGPIFIVHSNASLTLLNLYISGGLFTNGGAIYNAGTLIISNCVFAANSATNTTGVAGASATSGGNNGNGGDGGNGLSAAGGAIYSIGALQVSQSIFSNNTVNAGSGGAGGNGISAFVFGGNGGNGGNGGSAEGGAIVCTGTNNMFFATEFFGNTCTAGSGGAGGSAASGQFAGENGSGGTGGSASGGAIMALGSVFMTNCLFYGNTLAGGGSSGNSQAGGSARGGGLDLAGTVAPDYVENTTFFMNSCTGGAGGGNSSSDTSSAGNGGAAAGGGLASSAGSVLLLNCTIATNTLTPGAAGVGSDGADNGSIGDLEGADLARLAGMVKIGNCILSGGTNANVTNLESQTYTTNTQPNYFGVSTGSVTDLGYNISSDTSLHFTEATSTNAEDPVLDTALSNPGNTVVGLQGNVTLNTLAVLAVLPGSPAIGTFGVIPGVPGISFPATDQALQPRGTPTCIGAFEADPITTNGTPPGITDEATDQTNSIGGMATFEVTATNGSVGANLGYQWQFNGTNLLDGPNVSGAWSSSLTLSKLSLTNAGSYSVIVGDSTLVGVVTSTPAILTVIAPPRVLVQPPKTLKSLVGATATLSTTVSGSAPLSFQWIRDGTNLDDGKEILGATNNVLTIDPVLEGDAGAYSLFVTNAYGFTNSVTTVLAVEADAVPPVVSITLPAANARTAVPTLDGTASDNAQVTKVLYSLTNVNNGVSSITGTANLAAGSGSISNWSIPAVPLPGTNILTVQSVDYSGNKSKAVSREFFYEVPAAFNIIVAGTGGGTFNGKASVAGGSLPTNGAMLNLGESYSITAQPNKFSLFSNWVTSTGVSSSPTLNFIMSSSLSELGLTAIFSTNFFLAAAGTYNGLFFPTNAAVAEENSGMLYNLVLLNTGAYSATLLTAGQSYHLSTNFDVAGHSAFRAGGWQVDLALDSATPQITGTVSNAFWSANLTAGFASNPLPSAAYTLLLAPSAAVSALSPPGDGYATVTNHLGMVTLLGALADGTAYSQKVPVSPTGDLPIYESLYGTNGLLLGWINLTNLEAAAPTNQLVWIKQASRSSALYPGGFTNLLTLQGSPWIAPPARTAAIRLTNGQLVISNASLDLAYSDVVVSNNNAVLNVGGIPANALSGTINPATGQLLLTIGSNGKASPIKAYGAVLQNQTNAGGYFTTATNAGSVNLRSP